jgi:hypothetical protein
MGQSRFILAAAVAAIWVASVPDAAIAAGGVPRFNRDIRPILADKC